MNDLSDLAAPTAWTDLGVLLQDWTVTQRWFGGKAREQGATEIADACLLEPPDELGVPVLLVLLAVEYGEGAREHYHLPLVEVPDDQPDAIGTVIQVTIGDVTAHAGGARTLAAAATSDKHTLSTLGDVVMGAPVASHDVSVEGTPRWRRAEQSNSSAVIGEQWFLKVFRRLEAGPHPDVELTSVLTDAGYPHVAPQTGSLHWGEDAADSSALAMLSAYEREADDAWQLALTDADALARGDDPPNDVLGGMGDLGRVVAELHRVLAEELGADTVTPETLALWAHTMDVQAQRVLQLAAGSNDPLVREVVAAEQDVLARLAELSHLSDAGRSVRIHGDLHLGQLLRRHDGGWVVLDFEGEPARPLADRLRPHSPLRDVTGMLRSFDYAASFRTTDPPAALARWRDELAGRFLEAYESHGSELLPERPEDRRALRAAFVLDKAVYELGYELNNRPAWAAIPARGILRVLAGEAIEVTT